MLEKLLDIKDGYVIGRSVMKKILTLDEANIRVSKKIEMDMGSLHISRGNYPANQTSIIEVTEPTLAFILGSDVSEFRTQPEKESVKVFTGQFGLIKFIPKGTLISSSWNNTVDAVSVTFNEDPIKYYGQHHSYNNSIQPLSLFFDPLSCAIVNDLTQNKLEKSFQSAFDYLLHRVISKIQKKQIQGEKLQNIYRRVEQIAQEINQNLPDLYVDGKFIYESVFNEQQLRDAFIERFGCTPHTYALRAKVNSAKILLCETDLNLADIAGTLGFSDQSHFARVFKSHTSMTPKLFRSQNHNLIYIQK
ncbi:AraC family transcriptional regulator [Acinetobacter lactucae]|uniref:AraC family transcriptional regulator n=1 Tax=Acinetobacter lactucae TaxID=1785128 RepID=A0A3R9S7L0_9GAMM|nr:AraC family transcriptional regulator [Acinetobacter lactucae]RSO60756.1 AraC family transcriptional regulator [Acinetobacter lactucae]